MAPMSIEKLMRRLDRLDHNERQAELVAHVRGLAPELAEALGGQLAAGDVHQRQLALLVARLRGDLAPAWRALEDPSLSVRRIAARAVGRQAETIPPEVVDRLDPSTLRIVLRHLVRDGRGAVAQPLAQALIDRQRLAEAAYLLPVCPEPFTRAQLDTVAWPDPLWSRLAKYRPALMVAHVERVFGDQPERPDVVWRRFGHGVWCALAEHRPAEVAGWIDRFADPESLPVPPAALHALVRWSPAQVVSWLRARVPWVARGFVPAGLASRLRRLDDDEIVPLCAELLRASPDHFVSLVGQLPWPRRGQLFDAATAEGSTAHVEWPLSLLDVLPEPVRDREAARMLGLQRAAKDPAWRRELLGRRAIEHARAPLEQDGRSANANERAQAHAALVHSAALSRRGMAETLRWLERIRNEQDPVRQAVLMALARAPAHQFEDRDALDAVVAPVFDARDTSYGTRHHVASLAKGLIVANATTPGSPMFELGVSLLSRLAGHDGTLDLPMLAPNLPRGAERAIVEALMPWLRADEKRQHEQGIFRLWMSLGKRAWEVDELGALVEHVIWHGHKGNAGHAAARWIADPRTRDARVRDLVKRDRSASYLPGVFAHCHRRRQSLLHERFTDTAPRGRFYDGKVVVIPFVGRGMDHWTPELQRRYLDLIDAALREPRRYARSRAALWGMRARVPLCEVADLEPALRSEDVSEVEAGLGAMVWTDRPAPALPHLLANLEGDRARVAMYAMPRLVRLLPAAAVVEALSGLLRRPRLKVTVHKEALRLLGQVPSEAAVSLLLDTWSQPLHRDVRIATLHAARSVLDQPRAWELLARAARDESADVARAVVEVAPFSVAQAHRARYVEVMATVADHPDPGVREALFGALARGWSLAAVESVATVAARVVERLDPLDPWRGALGVLREGMRSSSVHPIIERMIATLLAAATDDVAPAGERDQLPYQRLLATMEQLCAARHPAARAGLVRLIPPLLAHPLGWDAGVGARVALAANEQLAATVLELLEAAPTPRRAQAVERAAAEAAARPNRRWSADEAGASIDTLSEGPTAARLAAVAMLPAFGPRWGWDAAWTERLARLRTDPDPDVRLEARRVWQTSA